MAPPEPAIILSLDLGNSTLDCLLTGPDLHRRQRVATRGAALVEFLADQRPAQALGLSVVAGGLDPFASILADLGCDLRVAGEDLACPLALAYPAGELGVDRWVAALAAQRRFGDALVVDCGTALTVDLVSAGGRFLGGMISAGLTALGRGLAVSAPSLPSAEPGALPVLPAGNSRDAVTAGLHHGFLSMLDGLVDRLLANGQLESPTLVLTGGDAEFVLGHSRHRFEHCPALIHEGLRCLLHANRSKS